MSKLIKCKACGAEIAKSAKACPQCGAKLKRPLLGTVLLILGIFLFISGIGSAMSGNNGPRKVGENLPTTSETPTPTIFGVNDNVELNDVIVTLNSITESKGSQFSKPASGNIFLLCEFTIENNSEKDLAISSLMCFEAYVDDFSTNMSITATVLSDKGQLDGTVAAGKKMNGVIGYEVPLDYKDLEIKFTPDFWRGTDITFSYEK